MIRKTSVLTSFLLVAICVVGLVSVLAFIMRGTVGSVQRPAPLPVTVSFQSDYVEDRANVLHAFTQTLDRMAKNWEKALGIKLKVITLNGGQEPIETLAVKLFEAYEIAKDTPTGGILILIDSENSRARIEVSYQLEGLYTDGMLGLLSENQLAPYASYQAVGMAVMDVLRYLEDYALEQAVHGSFSFAEQYRAQRHYQSALSRYSGGGGAQADIPAIDWDRDFKKPVVIGDQHLYAAGKTPAQTVESYKRALRDHIGYPTLPLFTEGSQEMRKRYPYAAYESQDRLRGIVQSEPLYFSESGDIAVAYAKSPAARFMPILMRKHNGLWQIDMVEAFKNLFFTNNGGFDWVNENTPYREALQKIYGTAKFYAEMRAMPLRPGALAGLVTQLEAREDALAKFLLAELLFRNAFALVDAIKYYEEAVQLAPNDPRFLSIFAQRALYFHFPDLILPYLRRVDSKTVLQFAQAYAQKEDYAAVESVLGKELKRNPYDLEVLRWLSWAQEMQGKQRQAQRTKRKRRALLEDKKQPGNIVALRFSPARPLFHSQTTKQVGEHRIYGHSDFAVTMTNKTGADVQIDSVQLVSAGTGRSSGLGDIKDYWSYPSAARILKPGQHRTFNRTWGFTIEPGHQRLSYIFDICWHQVQSDVKQCHTQRVDLISDQNILGQRQDVSQP